jgi:hypothetical protein
MERSIYVAGNELWQDLWFRATLFDVGSGLIIFYMWVFYKETSWSSRIIWFILIMTLGNPATAVYLLKQLLKLKDEDSVETLLLRKTS